MLTGPQLGVVNAAGETLLSFPYRVKPIIQATWEVEIGRIVI
jgi:hypothetical protein